MNLDRVSPGADVPNDINVIIEIPADSDPVKLDCVVGFARGPRLCLGLCRRRHGPAGRL